MEGFIVLDYAADWAAAIKQLAIWVSEGKIKPRNTVIKGGLEKAEQALVDLFKGVNTGKIADSKIVDEVWKYRIANRDWKQANSSLRSRSLPHESSRYRRLPGIG